jgi:hypothetical protein
LAVQFGRLNVEKMLRELTAKQFIAWEHYAQLEPFGEVRADWRAASIATTIANVYRGKSAPFKMEDFLLRFPDEQLAIARAIATAYSVSDRDMH